MSFHLSPWLVLLVVLVVCLPGHEVLAFGAGNIPSFAYMEGKAFRHGDIEDILTEIAKKSGGFAIGALMGKGGSKFGGLDVKRVYFGNWLRDYSQAVDIAGLKKLPLQTIINLCMALGFLAHGYATAEFEVTEERLGVYLPTEHIDNPKGYGEGEDARQYDRRLRGPVDVCSPFIPSILHPRELEVDPRTGMKNYIANEQGNWDTSKALVRRTLERCIQMGRQHRASKRKEDEYEAYRLLGQSLHTLEDFSAHSNFCELALVNMGYHDVFVHVGDHVRLQAPNGKSVAPLVTGTFGSSDFIHSLLGEATDHIASVSDLNKALSTARSRSVSGSDVSGDTLRDLLFKLPSSSSNDMSRDMEGMERIRAQGQGVGGGKRPEDMSPQEIHAVLWQVLSFRDSIAKKIENTIEKIPGLGPLIEKITDSISVFVFTTLEPFLKPVLKTASSQLMAASGEVINNHDQYEVFNDPRASDPTHSFLSKDHFNLILNEPAGHLARLVVKHTVELVAKAWDDTSMSAQHVTEEALQCLFHPDFHSRNSKIQSEMMSYMQQWINNTPQKSEILSRLTKDSVRNHRNTRIGTTAHTEGFGAAEGAAHNFQGYLGQQAHGIPGVSQAQNLFGKYGVPGSGQAADFYGSGGGMSNPNGPPPPMMSPRPGGHGHHSPAPPSFPGAGPGSDFPSAYPGGPPPGPPQSSYPGGPPMPSQSGYPGGPPGGGSSYPGMPSFGGPPEPGYGGPPEPGYGGPPGPGYGGPPGYGGGGGYGGAPGAGFPTPGGFGGPPGPPPMGFPEAQPEFGGGGPGYGGPPGGPGMPGAHHHGHHGHHGGRQ
ncbi:Het-C-domain-containing protein [Stereum hirsutum FP-91666 SS1]|uniref:Het-C-domain-containing protein n=1 Tax=Stereum hirsutum (strain FP-91666) TaxID=721885 RepID=UPI000440E1BB|nr:Het-C-domain-containing protein [Stereum hirsutum FP-91666 SS1]EIM88768.1 Het-C-domain-containing protein [Stereum hirsutum FP-91666 SS1]